MSSVKHLVIIPLILALTQTFNAYSQTDFVVIINKQNNSPVSQTDLIRLYTCKENTFENGEVVAMYSQPASSNIRSVFDSKVIGRKTAHLKADYSRRIFTGKGATPKNLKGDDEVVEHVTNNPNGIGYIEKDSLTDDVKVILEF